MLFTPWRNENTDLLNGCSTYTDSLAKMSKEVELQLKCYSPHSEMVSEILKEMTEQSPLMCELMMVSPMVHQMLQN